VVSELSGNLLPAERTDGWLIKAKIGLISIKCSVGLYTEGVLKWILKKVQSELDLPDESVMRVGVGSGWLSPW